MRRSLLAVPLVLAALAAGCTSGASSTSDFEGEEKQVADQVEKLETAGKNTDAKAICTEILATSFREEIDRAGSTCEDEVDKAIKDADDFGLEVEDVTIEGDTATARVKGKEGGKDQVRTFEFEREGSSWRATSLGS
jgi:uncharacterized cupredoxin-like copper-binding protein